jgi:hypothetical protein
VADPSATADPGDSRLESGEAWDAFCDALRGARRLVLGPGVPASPQLRAEGFRYLTRFLEAGIRTCVAYADPDHPEFCRMIERNASWGLDCPDCLYLYAPLRGDAVYRVWGTRGGANHLDIQVDHGHFAFGDISKWGTLSSLSDLELEVGADGGFELTLAAEERPGNWLRLGARAEFLLVRQYFNDWESEAPADLRIERVGAPPSAPPPRSAEIAARLDRLTQWIGKGAALWENMSRALVEGSPNRLQVFKPPDEDARGGLPGQAYGMGGFCCGPGQAVLLEFRPPTCRHWSVSLATWYWETVDYATRQSSLNGHQGRLDSDGVFRAVIAHDDPGVPNWLDTGGHTSGTVAARFLLADAAPEVSMRSAPLAEVRAWLPEDTPHVGPAERAASLERRRRAVQARYRR